MSRNPIKDCLTVRKVRLIYYERWYRRTFVMGRHFSFLLSLVFPTSDELVCVSFCTEQLSFCAVPSDCCDSSSVIWTHIHIHDHFPKFKESPLLYDSYQSEIYNRTILSSRRSNERVLSAFTQLLQPS